MASEYGYDGKRVVVSGGGGHGMGAAAVELLVAMGAEVHVLDLKEPPVDVASYKAVDVRQPAEIEAALDEVGGPIDALFNCIGVGMGVLPDLDVMVINFVAVRHLTELSVTRMRPGGAIVSIGSSGGMAWAQRAEAWLALSSAVGFSAAVEWCRSHPDETAGGYIPSKEALVVWTMDTALRLAPQGIRINCLSPGPTLTPMNPDPAAMTEALGTPMARPARADEQAHPLVWLNSDAASYVTGQNLVTDGGLSIAYWRSSLG